LVRIKITAIVSKSWLAADSYLVKKTGLDPITWMEMERGDLPCLNSGGVKVPNAKGASQNLKHCQMLSINWLPSYYFPTEQYNRKPFKTELRITVKPVLTGHPWVLKKWPFERGAC
jgi:hypothetical protein